MASTQCTPWKVDQRHESDRDLCMLRIRHRLDRGLPVSWRESALLSDWVFELAYRDQVVAYSPERGHFRVSRQPSDRGGLVRIEPMVGAQRV